MKKTVSMLSILIALASAALACGVSTTDTPTPKPTPTPATTPTPLPLHAAGWEQITLQSLCLEVEQSYPEMEQEFSLPLAEDVRFILNGLGLQVATVGAPCEATLSFVLVGKPLEATYFDEGKWLDCYSGAKFNGQVSLAMPGREPLTFPMVGYMSTSEFITYCQDDPQYAPFGRAWPEALLDGLTPLWGLPVTIQAARDEDFQFAARNSLKETGPEVIPILIQALGDGNASLRQVAAFSLVDKGPQAMDAVPVLIDTLDDETMMVRFAAGQALKSITGQDFGDDTEDWQEWWQGQP